VRGFVSKNNLNVSDECCKLLGEKARKAQRQASRCICRRFSRGHAEIQSPRAKGLFILVKASCHKPGHIEFSTTPSRANASILRRCKRTPVAPAGPQAWRGSFPCARTLPARDPNRPRQGSESDRSLQNPGRFHSRYPHGSGRLRLGRPVTLSREGGVARSLT
jgi:hypothetical protein